MQVFVDNFISVEHKQKTSPFQFYQNMNNDEDASGQSEVEVEEDVDIETISNNKTSAKSSGQVYSLLVS